MVDLVVLISGSGSNLKTLIDASREPGTPYRIVAVAADREASGLAHATAAGIPTFVIAPAEYADRAAWGDALIDAITRVTPNPLVVSAGLMRILPSNVVSAFSPRLINTHPALLPHFPGAHAVRDALAAGVSETGATVHIVDEGVDTGPVIRQRRVPVAQGDTEDVLHERIKSVERPLLAEVVRDIALGNLVLERFVAKTP